MEKSQKFKSMKVFTLSSMPEEIQEYFWVLYCPSSEIRYEEFMVSPLPSVEIGNSHIPVSKWMLENGAVRNELVLVQLGA